MKKRHKEASTISEETDLRGPHILCGETDLREPPYAKKLRNRTSGTAYSMRLRNLSGGGGANIVCKETSKRTKLHFFSKKILREHAHEPPSMCTADINIFI